ncbi:hypothetical protein EJB05_23925, partial [Eragrostis curvula]
MPFSFLGTPPCHAHLTPPHHRVSRSACRATAPPACAPPCSTPLAPQHRRASRRVGQAPAPSIVASQPWSRPLYPALCPIRPVAGRAWCRHDRGGAQAALPSPSQFGVAKAAAKYEPSTFAVAVSTLVLELGKHEVGHRHPPRPPLVSGVLAFPVLALRCSTLVAEVPHDVTTVVQMMCSTKGLEALRQSTKQGHVEDSNSKNRGNHAK